MLISSCTASSSQAAAGRGLTNGFAGFYVEVSGVEASLLRQVEIRKDVATVVEEENILENII